MQPGRDGRPRRLFFAVRPPQPVVDAVTALTAPHRSGASPGLTWVRTENLHVTLLFMGSVSSESQEPLVALADQVAATTEVFAARTGTVGAFPNASEPRVAFLAIEESTGALAALHRALVQACGPIVTVRADPLRAHLTLARARPGAETALRTALRRLRATAPMAHPINEIELIESVSGAHGVAYRTVSIHPLGSR